MQDGNIHCHIDNLSRSNGRNGQRIAVATAAYNAGERLWSEREQRYVNFDSRVDVVFSAILVPDGAPDWTQDRTALWNRVDLTARRKDARLAKKIEAAITRDIPKTMWASLMKEFAAPYVELGCVADIAIHEDGTGHNPHVHVLLTTRFLTDGGFGAKITALEQRAFVKTARAHWADITNTCLEKCGSTLRVDHRSYKAHGIGLEPTQHRGPNANERRRKREHARRIREEQTMAYPTDDERRQYPLLTNRETWPPEPEASPAMTEAEREELHRYRQDQKIERNEEWVPEEVYSSPLIVEREDTPWYEKALDKALGDDRNQRAEYRRQRHNREAYEQWLHTQAERTERTETERQFLASLGVEQQHLLSQAEALMHERRVSALRNRQEWEVAQQLEADLPEAAKPMLHRAMEEWFDPEPVFDFPEPGPNGELISRVEQLEAQERMLDEMECEQDHDRER